MPPAGQQQLWPLLWAFWSATVGNWTQDWSTFGLIQLNSSYASVFSDVYTGDCGQVVSQAPPCSS